MLKTIATTFLIFFALFIVFRLLELRRPRGQRMPVFRRGFKTDIGYVVMAPVMSKIVDVAVVVAAVVPVALIIYGKVDKDLILNGFGPLRHLPYGAQSFLILLTGDFVGYWMHRAFHGRRLWRLHAVHHSSVDLDWLSAVRTHPVNDVLQRIATTIPVLFLGFAPLAVAAVLPVLMIFAIMLHANLDWDFGPLRKVIASPRYHRWHHTDESEARDKNFAGLFPLWDLLFGTYYMPADKLPSRFGTATPVPNTLFAQLKFPFRRRMSG